MHFKKGLFFSSVVVAALLTVLADAGAASSRRRCAGRAAASPEEAERPQPIASPPLPRPISPVLMPLPAEPEEGPVPMDVDSPRLQQPLLVPGESPVAQEESAVAQEKSARNKKKKERKKARKKAKEAEAQAAASASASTTAPVDEKRTETPPRPAAASAAASSASTGASSGASTASHYSYEDLKTFLCSLTKSEFNELVGAGLSEDPLPGKVWSDEEMGRAIAIVRELSSVGSAHEAALERALQNLERWNQDYEKVLKMELPRPVDYVEEVAYRGLMRQIRVRALPLQEAFTAVVGRIQAERAGAEHLPSPASFAPYRPLLSPSHASLMQEMERRGGFGEVLKAVVAGKAEMPPQLIELALRVNARFCGGSLSDDSSDDTSDDEGAETSSSARAPSSEKDDKKGQKREGGK